MTNKLQHEYLSGVSKPIMTYRRHPKNTIMAKFGISMQLYYNIILKRKGKN